MTRRRASSLRPLRLLLGLLGLALLSACATNGPRIAATQEAASYQQQAAHSYTPPGPPGDPWGPYIQEASQKFDVPPRWIREVMRVESGGKPFLNGSPITSDAGAMGVMQVMPETFDEMRQRYGLGSDPYDPHNSILAGTAYIREMYELYGAPGFLAAYNAGPGRLDDYLTRNKPLPDETRRYVAMIGPNILGSFPNNRAAAEQLAVNQLPVRIPPGPRYQPTRLAHAGTVRMATARSAPSGAPLRLASLPPMPPKAPAAPVPQSLAYEPPAPPSRRGFHLIPSALADALPPRHGGEAGWAVQIGAFASEAQARAAAGAAHGQIAAAHAEVVQSGQGGATLYRARLTGMTRDAAEQACERLSHGHERCIVLSPSAQS